MDPKLRGGYRGFKDGVSVAVVAVLPTPRISTTHHHATLRSEMPTKVAPSFSADTSAAAVSKDPMPHDQRWPRRSGFQPFARPLTYAPSTALPRPTVSSL